MGDNKFGKCCDCPARMSDGRLFTTWESSSFHNLRLTNHINTTNSYDFRQKLQQSPVVLALGNNIACRNSGKIKFLTESDAITPYFDKYILRQIKHNPKYVGIKHPSKYYIK